MSSFLIDSGVLSRGLPGSPGGESLSFASPKESNQRKGDPQSGPLRGSLKNSTETENLETSLLRSRRTSRFFNPSRSNFSSPARTGWGKDAGSALTLALSRREREEVRTRISPPPVLAGLSSAGVGGNKFLDVRRLRSRLVSKNSADPEQRKVPEAKRRDPDCGSPFLWLLSFGEAKESELPPGNPRHSPQCATSPIKAQRRQQEANK